MSNIEFFKDYLFTTNFRTYEVEIFEIRKDEGLEFVGMADRVEDPEASLAIDEGRELLFAQVSDSKINVYDLANLEEVFSGNYSDRGHFEAASIVIEKTLPKLGSIQNKNKEDEWSGFLNLKLLGEKLIVSATSHIKIYDVSDVSNITLLGQYSMNSPDTGCFNDFSILKGRYVVSHRVSFLCTPHGGAWGNYIIDIQDPENPKLVKNFQDNTSKLIFKGDYGYGFDLDGEAIFYDFSDLDNISEIGRYDVVEGNKSIDNLGIWEEDYLYYKSRNSISVFNISDPASPSLLLNNYDLGENFNLYLNEKTEIFDKDGRLYFPVGGIGVLKYGTGDQGLPKCEESDWSYTLTPEECPKEGVQTKQWTRMNECQGGVTYPESEQVECGYKDRNKDLEKATQELRQRLKGRILLQVEEQGQAYYINPDDLSLHFLGRPSDAFQIMREQGLGISNDDINRIQPSLKYLRGKDSDGDGLPDDFERAIGTDPHNPDTSGNGYTDKTEIKHGYDPLKKEGRLPIDEEFAKRQAGKILLQVEQNGEAWYINPEDNQRYFLGRPADAFEIMRNLGLGISNQDFEVLSGKTTPPGDPNNGTESDQEVVLYYFWGGGSYRVSSEKYRELFDELEKEYSNLKIRNFKFYENQDNSELARAMAESYMIDTSVVPMMFIGDLGFSDYQEGSEKSIRDKIEFCLEEGCSSPGERVEGFDYLDDGCEPGQKAGGGILVVCDAKGRPHLVAMENDILYDPSDNRPWGERVSWGCPGTLIGTDRIDGETNTRKIVDNCQEENIAARLCFDSNEAGYDDWFLPSLSQLRNLREEFRFHRDGALISDSFYWSSSEYDEDSAFFVELLRGLVNNAGKSNTRSVRCVRTF